MGDEQMHRTEAGYRLIVDATIEGALAVDSDGVLLHCNEQFARLRRQSLKQLIGLRFLDLMASEDRPRLEALMSNAKQAVARAQSHLLQVDGARVPVLIAVSDIPSSLAQDVYFVVVTDLSELEQIEIKRERDQLARIVENAHDAIIGKTLDGVVTAWNRGAEALFGYGAHEMVGQNIDILEPPERKGEAKNLRTRLVAGGNIQQLETQRVSKSGKRLDVVLTFSPVTDDAGRPTGFSEIVHDITERRQTERALQESERRMASLLGNVQLVAIMLDEIGQVTYCNDFFLRLVGKTPEQVIGSDWFENFIPSEQTADVRKVYAALMAEQQAAFHHENKIISHDGSLRLIHWDNAVLHGTDGTPVGVASLGADITDYRDALVALEADEQRFRKLIENTSDAIVILREDGTIGFISQAVTSIAGYTPKEMVNTSFLEYIHPSETDSAWDEVRALLANPGGEPLRTKHRYRHRNGTWLTAEVVSSNQMKVEGIRGIVVTLHDVTLREQTEEQLRLASVLIEQSSSVLFRWRATDGWPVEYVSDNVRQWGYEPQALISGEPAFPDLIHPEDLNRIAQEVADHVARGDENFTQEYRILTASGEGIWVNDRTAVERDAQGTPLFFQGVVTDISESKRAAEQLNTSKQLLEDVLNTIPARVFWKDRNLVYRGANTRFAQDAGFQSSEQLIGKTDSDMPWHDQVAQYQADDRAVIASGKAKLLIEEPQTTPAGDTIILLTSKVPLRDEAGEVSGVIGVYMDVTEQKQREAHLKLFRALVDQADIGIEVIDPGSHALSRREPNHLSCAGFDSR